MGVPSKLLPPMLSRITPAPPFSPLQALCMSEGDPGVLARFEKVPQQPGTDHNIVTYFLGQRTVELANPPTLELVHYISFVTASCPFHMFSALSSRFPIPDPGDPRSFPRWTLVLVPHPPKHVTLYVAQLQNARLSCTYAFPQPVIPPTSQESVRGGCCVPRSGPSWTTKPSTTHRTCANTTETRVHPSLRTVRCPPSAPSSSKKPPACSCRRGTATIS